MHRCPHPSSLEWRGVRSREALLAALCLLLTGPLLRAEDAPAEPSTDWPTVITRLRQQLDAMPGQTDTRRELGIAYNNFGVSLVNQGRFEEAQQQLQRALDYDPGNPQFRANLVVAHLEMAKTAYQTHQPEQARGAIQHALDVDPNAANAYALLGELEYESQRLKEASAAWHKALELDPGLSEVRTRLEQLTRELPVESKFGRLAQFNFDVRYTKALDMPVGFDIRDMLLDARRQVGGDFALWPKSRIVVLVYQAEEFRKLRQETPDWVAGQYDGKIRVPLPGQTMDRDAVARVLFHEYTHAIVHELTQDRCPTWLNEGLADYEAWKGKTRPWTLLQAAVQHETLIPWAELSDHFSTGLSAQEVAFAYEESHSIVSYLAARFGFWKMRQLLKAIDAGTPLDEALTSTYRNPVTRLEKQWRAWLDEQLASTHPTP